MGSAPKSYRVDKEKAKLSADEFRTASEQAVFADADGSTIAELQAETVSSLSSKHPTMATASVLVKEEPVEASEGKATEFKDQLEGTKAARGV